MPSSITHWLIAREAQKQLPAEVASVLSAAPETFFLGAQGGDMFFFAKSANRAEGNLGKYLHRNKVYELFCSFVESVRALPEGQRAHALAYCLGYAAHYCTDVAFHPFVYRYLEQNNKAKRVHQRLENDWDVYFARKIEGREAERYPFPDLKACDEEALLAVWRHATRALSRTEMTRAVLHGGIRNFAAYLAFFHGGCYAAQKGWAGFDRLFHAHLLSCLYPRSEPDPDVISGAVFERAANAGGERAASADDLFARAVDESAEHIGLLYDAVQGAPLKKELFDRHLLTGEHIA